MRTGSILLALLALLAAAMLVAAGCTSAPPANQTTPTVPAGTATPDLTPGANVTGNVTPVNTSVTNTTAPVNITAPFVNSTWRWIARSGSESIQVPSPDRYTIAFNQNGTYAVRADCNTGSGNYTVDASKVTVMPPAMTEVYCGDASLDRKFVPALAQVTGFQTDSSGRLVLVMVNPNERLTFEKVVVT
jgi:heat shock protein HslJ